MLNQFVTLMCSSWPLTLQILHVYSTLKRRGNVRFHVVSTWNTRGVFVGNYRWSGSVHDAKVSAYSKINEKT